MYTPDATVEQQHRQTRAAFDSVAADYDGPLGNNALIQRMRRELWNEVTERVPAGARLLDLGCGPGLDAVYFAQQGYDVVAIDSSSEMVTHARRRVAAADIDSCVSVKELSIDNLHLLDGHQFDAIYSNLGALNCVSDLHTVSQDCARLSVTGAPLILSVIGRYCPWEMGYYGLRGDLERVRVRYAPGPVPVSLNGHRVWTTYYTPREFYSAFAREFELLHYRGLAVIAPPPYLIGIYRRLPRLCDALFGAERIVAALPIVRNAGDHFLMVLSARD